MTGMRSVYDEFTDEERAAWAAQAAARASASMPRNAEIATHAPAWFVATTWPAQERTALRHLIRHRFGCCLPEARSAGRFGGRHSTIEIKPGPLLPGYLFVFLWAPVAQAGRVLACTGVSGLLSDEEGRPSAIPDEVINAIRAIENRFDPLATEVDDLVWIRRKKRLRQSRITRVRPIGPEDVTSVHSWCAAWLGNDTAERAHTLVEGLAG